MFRPLGHDGDLAPAPGLQEHQDVARLAGRGDVESLGFEAQAALHLRPVRGLEEDVRRQQRAGVLGRQIEHVVLLG
jgi:hypothetical protein